LRIWKANPELGGLAWEVRKNPPRLRKQRNPEKRRLLEDPLQPEDKIMEASTPPKKTDNNPKKKNPQKTKKKKTTKPAHTHKKRKEKKRSYHP